VRLCANLLVLVLGASGAVNAADYFEHPTVAPASSSQDKAQVGPRVQAPLVSPSRHSERPSGSTPEVVTAEINRDAVLCACVSMRHFA
jgi:hypothetical protein